VRGSSNGSSGNSSIGNMAAKSGGSAQSKGKGNTGRSTTSINNPENYKTKNFLKKGPAGGQKPAGDQ
jgi:hypothetical protein